MQLDGRDARELLRAGAVQREPAWSPDGRRIAFAADRGDGFDIYAVSARGGAPERVTSASRRRAHAVVDARRPHRLCASRPRCHAVGSLRRRSRRRCGPARADPPDAIARQRDPSARVAGRRARGVRVRSRQRGRRLRHLGDAPRGAGRRRRPARGPATRVARLRGQDGYPVVVARRRPRRVLRRARRCGFDVGRDRRSGSRSVGDAPAGGSRAADRRRRCSRRARGGSVAWSPDGRTLAIGEIPEPEPVYNGNPSADDTDRPPLFGVGGAYQLWTVAAPRPVDEGDAVAGAGACGRLAGAARRCSTPSGAR